MASVAEKSLGGISFVLTLGDNFYRYCPLHVPTIR
jgi:hypothetical protein